MLLSVVVRKLYWEWAKPPERFLLVLPVVEPVHLLLGEQFLTDALELQELAALHPKSFPLSRPEFIQPASSRTHSPGPISLLPRPRAELIRKIDTTEISAQSAMLKPSTVSAPRISKPKSLPAASSARRIPLVLLRAPILQKRTPAALKTALQPRRIPKNCYTVLMQRGKPQRKPAASSPTKPGSNNTPKNAKSPRPSSQGPQPQRGLTPRKSSPGPVTVQKPGIPTVPPKAAAANVKPPLNKTATAT